MRRPTSPRPEARRKRDTNLNHLDPPLQDVVFLLLNAFGCASVGASMARKGEGSAWHELQKGNWSYVRDTKKITTYGSSGTALDPRMRDSGRTAQTQLVGPSAASSEVRLGPAFQRKNLSSVGASHQMPPRSKAEIGNPAPAINSSSFASKPASSQSSLRKAIALSCEHCGHQSRLTIGQEDRMLAKFKMKDSAELFDHLQLSRSKLRCAKCGERNAAVSWLDV